MGQVDWPDELIEKAARAFYRPETQDWAVPPLLERNLRRALDAIADHLILSFPQREDQ